MIEFVAKGSNAAGTALGCQDIRHIMLAYTDAQRWLERRLEVTLAQQRVSKDASAKGTQDAS